MKKLIRFSVSLWIIFFCFNLWCEYRPIVLITIPKCGSHLINKCITKIISNLKYPGFAKGVPSKKRFDSGYCGCHLKYTQDNKKALYGLGKSIKFFMYRDPRDQLISHIFWAHKMNENFGYKDNNLKFKSHTLEPKLDLNKIYSIESSLVLPENLSSNFYLYKDLYFDELVLQLIYGGRAYYDRISQYLPNYKTKGIADYYGSFMGWKKLEDVCVVRFEDLIGSKGGGSDLIQIKTIKKIALYLGKEISNQKAKQIAIDLFGGAGTFRQGQIGGWKKYFKEIHKKCFKEQAGQLLIDLGYEKDLNW